MISFTNLDFLSVGKLQTDTVGIMLGAHGPIFLSNGDPRKSRSEGPIFIGVILRTRIDFLSQTKHRTYLTIFHRSVIWRTRPGFLLELFCVTMAGEVPLLDYVTPIFYRTEVGAHGPIFSRKQLR